LDFSKGKTPRISELTQASDGTYLGGNEWVVAPDGIYVGGSAWILALDGTYVGADRKKGI